MTYNTGPKIVTDGLVLCLDAADRNSYPGTGSAWYDLSGNGNNGTINGATFDGGNNGSFSFDGDADSINFGNSVAEICSPSGSIEIWVRTNSTSTSQEILYLTDNRDRAIYIENSRYQAAAYNGTDLAFKVLVGPLATTSWFQCVLSYIQNDGSNSIYSFYVNGQLSDQIISNTTTDAASDDNHNILGIKYNTGSENQGLPARSSDFNGYCSICRFYNRVLTADEVRRNYNATKGRFGL